jgi:hypothetical protein
MKVRDFAAELISEIADEFGWLVFKYECSSPSCGNIVFELEIGEDEDDEARRYKILDYSGYEVNLMNPAERTTIDLHEPESVDDIRDWFDNLEESFDSPFGFGIFGGYNTWPSYGQQAIPSGQIQITPQPAPQWDPAFTPAMPYDTGTYHTGGFVSITTTAGTTKRVSPYSGQLTVGGTQNLQATNKIPNQNIFSFNPSFGSLSLGP